MEYVKQRRSLRRVTIKLEDGFRATLQQEKNCALHAHTVCIDSDKFDFSLPQFKGLTCF